MQSLALGNISTPLSALTSAIGDELNDFSGGVSSLTLSTTPAEVRIVDGAGLGPTANGASAIAPGTTVLLPNATLTAVQVGDRFRLLTPGPTVTEAAIETVGTTSITLVTPGIGSAFSDASYEIVRPASTQIALATTLGFFTPTATERGRVVINNTLYTYSSMTSTTLVGVQYLDAEGTFRDGVPHDIPPLTEVVDYTEAFSAVDTLRRSIYVRTATSASLDALGRDLGVPRAAVQPEAEYRQLIEVMAYARRGTTAAIEAALDVLVGAGNYELFTDNTGGRAQGIDGQSGLDVPFNNPNTLFIRVISNDGDTFNGKAFAEGPEYAPLNAGVATTTLAANNIRPSAAAIARVELAPDPLPDAVARRGIDGTLTFNPNSVVFTAGTGMIANAVDGDILIIDAGMFTGRRLLIDTVDGTNTNATILPSDQIDTALPTTGTADVPRWRIVRPGRSDFRTHLPSEEARELFPPPVTEFETSESETVFEYTGTTESDIQPLASGIRFTANANAQTYRRRARVVASSDGYVEWRVLIEQDSVDTAPGNAILEINDGSRTLRIGFRTGATTVDVGILDGTNAFATIAGVTNPVLDATPATTPFIVRLEKSNTSQWRVWVDDALLFAVAHDSVLASAAVTTTPGGFSFGKLAGAYAPVGDPWIVQSCQWQFETGEDYFSTTISAALATPSGGTAGVSDTGTNGVFAAGGSLRVVDWSTASSVGGLPLGEWVIDDNPVSDPDVVEVTGRTTPGGRTSLGTPDLVISRDVPNMFRYPDHLGAEIELLTGPNAGAYTISEILHADLSPVAPAGAITQSKVTLDGNKAADPLFQPPLRATGSVVRVSNPPTNGFTAVDRLDFRLRPGWVAQTATAIVPGTGSYSSGTRVVTHRAVNINRDPPNSEPIMAVYFGTTLSSQLWTESTANARNDSDGLTHYAYYLYDNVGYTRDIVELLTVAGVIPEFFRLTRDAAGLHITD